MAIPTGLGASLGLKKESSYGTYVAPTLFLPFDSESFSRQQNRTDATGGFRAGRSVPLVGLDRLTTRSAGGEFTVKGWNKGLGSIFNLMHGNTVTPEKIGASTAYKQIHKLGENNNIAGKSLTIQVGIPDIEGTVQPFSYIGSKITNLGISIATGGELMLTPTIASKDEVTAEALASPSYAAGLKPFVFTDGELTVASDSLPIVGSADISIPMAMKTDRFGLNKSALAAEPIGPNDWVQASGSATMEFKGLTQYNHFTAADEVKVVLIFEGAVISESNKEKLKIEMPACKFTGTSPSISSPDVVEVSFPFSVFDNGTEAPITIEYVSADTTIV